MSFVVPALAAISGGLSLIGGIQGAQAANANGAYQRAVMMNEASVREMNARAAERDAEVAEGNARQAGFITQERAQEQDFSARGQIGEVIVGQGASGLRSPVAGLEALARLAGRDRSRITREGMADAREFRGQADAFRTEVADNLTGAGNARADGAMAVKNAKMDARNSILSGVAGAVSGFTSAGEFLIDDTQRVKARADFDKMFRRRRYA